MASAAIARNVGGIIGNVISFGLFFLPVCEIIKKKAAEEFKPDPSPATVSNCAFWVFYGKPFVHPNSLLVVAINSIGHVLEFIYLVIFLIYATNKRQAKGAKTKSVKYMPFWLSLTNFLNGLCWTTYALIHPSDIYVLISNGLGAVSGLVQLTLYACYCSCKPAQQEGEDASKPNVVQLSALQHARANV